MEIEPQRVDPRTIPVWRWQGLAAALVCALPLGMFAFRDGGALGGGAMLAYAIVALLCIWQLPRACYRSLTFVVDERGIWIRRGILWRSQIALPRLRVQHSDVSQGPVQRSYGVATLKLYTAGSRYTKIELPGLQHDAALQLRDALLARGGDSGV
jgi:membrane protein YdbS with pleckstrin-like domain